MLVFAHLMIRHPFQSFYRLTSAVRALHHSDHLEILVICLIVSEGGLAVGILGSLGAWVVKNLVLW